MSQVRPITLRLDVGSLPGGITRWFGIRNRPQGPARQESKYVCLVWSFIGAFAGMAVHQAVLHTPYFAERGVPPLIVSYGAASVLCFSAIESPFAQPVSVWVGNSIGAFVGLVTMSAFKLNSPIYEVPAPQRVWIAASLANAITIVVMRILNVTHPPGGAVALLPIIDPVVTALGWYFLPVVMTSSVLMIAVAMVTNNIQRRYPTYWCKPPKKKDEESSPSIPLPLSGVVVPESSQDSSGSSQSGSKEEGKAVSRPEEVHVALGGSTSLESTRAHSRR